VDEILRRRAVAESSHHRGRRRAPGSRPSRRRSLLSAPLVISALVVLLLASPAGAASSTLEAAVGVPGSAPSLTALLALQQAELTVADGSASDFLGWSVALSGDTALVGSPGDQVGAVPWRGCAYVFVRSGSTWTLQQRLTAADAGTLDDELGWSVALSGDTALVGGPYVGADDRGAVYVFVRSAGTWSQEGPALVATDGAANDYFGCSVALSGDMALIGAHGADVGSQTNQGAAYVFVRSGSTWAFEKQLIAGDVDDAFGYSVALAGDTAVVGAPTGGADVEGAARVFVRSGSDWALQQQLTLADAAAGDYFGYSVALSGDTALVGAPHDDVGADADQGSAAVFVRSGSNWSLDGRLTAAAGDGDDALGHSVAVSGDTALVGAYYDVGGVSRRGSASVFARSVGEWTEQDGLSAVGGSAADAAGYSVALSGDLALVGAPYDDVDARSDQGSALVFLLDGAAPVTTASFAPAANSAGWRKTPVTVTLAGDDAGSGVATTGYRRLGDLAWTPYAAPFQVSDQGESTWEYGSTDEAGNSETPVAVTFRIDSKRPVTAGYAATARKGKTVKLGFKVTDALPGCARATVVLKIYSGKAVKRTIRAGVQRCNVKTTKSWRCTLAKGRYTVKVYATDIAGNVQSKVGSARLTVR